MAYGTVNADVIGTSVSGSNLGAGNASIMKNRIINGSMVIDQRNAGASLTVPLNFFLTYSLDRWSPLASVASKYTVQQNAGSVTPPVGFNNYLGATSSSAYSVVAGDYFGIGQRIEGFNFADLNWGTANAKTITISAWVYSSLTGTFGGVVQNSAQTRSYPFTYSISTANTWTQISVTIAGDTSGTWIGATNGVGLTLVFSIGTGSTLSGTAGAWAASNYVSATGATSVVGTSGATFYITGVQLEVGSSATGFEYVNYQTSLANCQRYYWQQNSETSFAGIASGQMNATTTARLTLRYPQIMRAIPTVSMTSYASFVVNQGGTDITPSAMTPYANSQSVLMDITTTAGTAGRGATLIFGNVSTGSIQATAEL
jgi:hypothetical protein